MIENLKLHRPNGFSETHVQRLGKIGSDLFRVLSAAQKSFTHKTLGLSQSALQEMCTVIVEFVEDVLNEIGIWESLEKYNRSLFGNPLPFSLPAGQEMPRAPINKSRIHYLLWYKYPEFCDGLILSPEHRDLNLLAEEVFRFFDEQRIAGFPGRSGIKMFMNRPNRYGWDVKKKLLWLGQHSYLFRHSYELHIRENNGKPEIPVIDDFVCQIATTWSGLSVPDILAEILDISKSQREELQSWYLRHFAYFKIESVQGPLVVARNIICDKSYVIRVGEESSVFKVGYIYAGSLVPWNSEWYWSGQQTGYGELPKTVLEEIKKEMLQKAPQVAYRYCDSVLKKAEESVKLHYRNFVNFHGDDLVVFPDGYAMAAAVQRQHRMEYQEGSKALVKDVMKKHNLKNPHPTYSYPQELLDSDNGIGLFFNKKEGQEIMQEFNDVVSGFKKKGINLREEERESIRGFIESPSISPEFVQKIANNYGAESVAETFLLRDTGGMDYLKYILRKYKGAYFRKRFPNLSLK